MLAIISIPAIVAAFAHDELLQAVVVLITLDLVLGVVAALKLKQFSFSRIADFARDDLLGKVVPWAAVYAAAKAAPSVAILGVDLDVVQKAVFALVAASLVASLATSLEDLGLKVPVPLARK